MNLVRGGTSASPASLFAGGEPGVWYDPSDLTTLFQNNTGTTPVTAPAQTVGLMLDKSQGLVLGSELRGSGAIGLVGTATAATYNTATGVGTVTRVDASNQSFVQWTGLTAAYSKITVSCTSGVGITVRAGTYAGSGTVVLSGQEFTLYSLSSGGAITITSSSATSGFTVTSIKEAPGNHATQATSTQRPTYGINPITGTRNVMLWTEDFTVSPWAAAVLGTSTRTNTTSPYIFGLGLITVTSANGGIRQSRSGLTSGQPYTLSFYLESAVANINVVFENGTSGFGALHVATINPSTGAFSSVSGFTSTTSAAFGTGRIYTLVSAPAGGTLIANIEWRIPAGSGTLLLGRPQFEIGSTATAYQKVMTQYEVTEAGVQSASYIAFDGVDDGMVTNTITPATNKVQVFTGVRKLSDAARGMLVELGDGVTTTGTFNLEAPSSAAPDYKYRSGGTLLQQVLPTGFASPITNVLSGLADISGDSVVLRANGAQVGSNTSDQGTGNYLAYPLYLGRRNAATLPFNGRLYSLITRFGANLTTGQITSTESWVNGETGAY